MVRHRHLGMLSIGALVGLLSAPAHAIFGFGIHGGKDFVSVGEGDFGPQQFVAAAQKLDIQINPALYNTVQLHRNAVSNPWMGGGQIYVDAIPFIALELSADVALQRYEVRYKSTLNAAAGDTAKALFGRISAYATARRDLIKLPMVAFYLGGGLDYNWVAPTAGPDLIVDIYGTGNPNAKSPDIKKYVQDHLKSMGSFGYHALVGVRFKPVLVPFAVNLETKYTNTGASGFGRPQSIMSVYLGTSIAL